ncbi:MAG: hypothetical protein LBU83_06470 [Bacteroidales bacterium]|jgi:hypothetical protein|nr:hypothetical protein [Bacteroidales bacterium]
MQYDTDLEHNQETENLPEIEQGQNNELKESPCCTPVKIVQVKNDTVLTPISSNANDLLKEVNTILYLDLAPDNAKRFIKINRKYRNLFLKNEIAGCIDCEEQQLPEAIIDKINDIDTIVNTELLKKNIVNINDEDRSLRGNFYLSDRTISSIIPDTLLTQILGRNSKLDYHCRNKTTIACAAFGDDKAFQEARVEIESKKYLAISLLDNSTRVMCLPDRNNYSVIKSTEKFYSENISIFNPKINLVRKYCEIILEDEFNMNNYVKHLTEVANNNSLSLYFLISRQQIAVVLTTLFHKILELHKSGRVHCDLKPQNILCFKDGLTPFDAINVKKGEVSAGMTINFCAPEQVLTLPVSPATDIYNLGLIILSVIDGIIYGKTSNYIIPVDRWSVKNVKLLTEPMIYIDYDSANIQNKEGIPFWRSFLEKCLAFEQKNRFPNMDSFMNEYDHLLKLYPLENDIKFKPNFGNLSLVKINGEIEAAWFIQ